MRNSLVSEAVKNYFKTTTLHGFKYLYSSYCVDRVGWLLCICTSTCCAGLLCVVLLSRFLATPALLTLSGNTGGDHIEDRVPYVMVCPPTASVADMFLDKLSPNQAATKRIPVVLTRLLSGKTTADDQIELLNNLLITNNVTLSEVMLRFTANCSSYTRKCRYKEFVVPCEQLFEKELTIWGICCVMRPQKLIKLSERLPVKTHDLEMLELILQCTYQSKFYGCQFFTMFQNEDYALSNYLFAGFFYTAYLKFTAMSHNPATENLLENTCVADQEYSRTFCLFECAEKFCGCSFPVKVKIIDNKTELPMCTVTGLACLWISHHKNNMTCNCLPSCKKIKTTVNLESSRMNCVQETFDPFYSELNATASIIIKLRVFLRHSRIFLLNPTETWLTLLSSLGGVFNMFLGVGLFSALELLFLILVKLPIAIKKSSGINTVTYSSPVTRY